MGNALDDLFAAKTSRLAYAWTFTDIDPVSGLANLSFASGMLGFTEAPISREYFMGPARYVDSDVKVWGASGERLRPASFVAPRAPSQWIDQLMIRESGGGHSVSYGKRSNFGVEVASFTPDVHAGGGFPGVPDARTAVLVGRIWLGVITIVLAPPDAFSSLRGGEQLQAG